MIHSLSLALLYALAAALWIFGSDQLMLQLNLDPEASMRLQMTKSFAFIIATALLLFFLLQQIEVRKRPEMGSKPSPPSVWMPVILFSLLMALAVIPGIIAYYEVSRHFGESTTRTWLFAWDGLVLLFALTTAAACILCWWRTTRSRFALERFHDENEQSKLRHRYEALLRQSLDVVLLLAEDGTIIDANDCVREYYGRTPEELRGQHVRELRFPSARDRVADDYRRVAETGGVVFERLHQRSDGTSFPVEISARAISDHQRNYFQSVVRDISERKRTEVIMAEQALRFRATFEQVAVGMAHIALDGHWLRVNDRLCAIVGYSRQELLRKTFQQITHPDDLEKDLWLLEQMLADQIKNYSMEKRYFHKDGSIIWVSLTVSLLRNAAGLPEYLVAVVDDISSRKRIERRLARISRFYAALNSTNQAILHNKGTADQLFEEICRIAVKCGELKGAWIGLVDPKAQQLRVVAAFGDLRGRLVSLGEPILEGSALPYQPARMVLGSGSHWLSNDLLDRATDDSDWQVLVATTGVRSCAAFPLKQGGTVIGAFSLYASEAEFFDLELVDLLNEMAADVSFAVDNFEREARRRRAEEALRASESRYRALFEAHPIPMWVYDLETLQLLAANDAAIAKYGYAREEFLGLRVADLRSDADAQRLLEDMTQAKEGLTQATIWKHRRRDGTLIDMEITSHPVAWGGRSARIVMAHDVTEQLRVEQELRLAAAVYEQSGEGILVSDRNNTIIMVNRAFTEVTGYELEEVRGQNPRILSSGRQDPHFYQTMWSALRQRGHWQGEIWNRRKNGEIYSEWLNVTALRDAANQVSHYIGIFNTLSAHRATR